MPRRPIPLSKTLRRLYTQEQLRKALGYKHKGTISRKLAGKRAWSTRDAKRLEKLTKGQIKRRHVLPGVYA